jgi:hypothetical protein
VTSEEAAALTPAVIERAMRKRERERKVEAARIQEAVLREAGYTGLTPKQGILRT